MNDDTRHLLRSFVAASAALSTLLLLGTVAGAWSIPTGTAGQDNTLPPMHEGTGDQTKTGAFALREFIAAEEFCLGVDCIASWNDLPSPTPQQPQGAHCGHYTNAGAAPGWIACLGYNPANSCPPGYVRRGGDFQSPGNRYIYTCVKT